MKIQQLRWLMVTLILVGALVLGLHPAGRKRAELVTKKLRGELPVTWDQLAIEMVPGAHVRSLIRRVVRWSPPHWVRPLDFPDSPKEGFKFNPITDGPTSRLHNFESHFSVLQAGQTPHPPHQHREEEMIVLLSGGLVVIREEAGTRLRSEEQVAPGDLVYHASQSSHTLRSVGPGPARYLIFKWDGEDAPIPGNALTSQTISYRQAFPAQGQSDKGFTTTLIFESPTHFLSKLHCHVSTLRPGAGYDPHDDDYDVAIVLLKGTIETVGQRVEAPSAIFYSADRPHGMRNVGDGPAEYVVFEFHGPLAR